MRRAGLLVGDLHPSPTCTASRNGSHQSRSVPERHCSCRSTRLVLHITESAWRHDRIRYSLRVGETIGVVTMEPSVLVMKLRSVRVPCWRYHVGQERGEIATGPDNTTHRRRGDNDGI